MNEEIMKNFTCTGEKDLPEATSPDEYKSSLESLSDERSMAMQHKNNLLVIGHGGHGKDTFCEILRDDHGLGFVSSSHAAAKHAVFPVLREKYGYETVDECLADRHNHRAEWKRLIKQYNTPNLTRLADQIYSECDTYCGLRDRDEFNAIVAKYNPQIIWVDASERKPPEPADSMELTEADAHIVINNNGAKSDLRPQAHALCGWM